MLTALDRGLSAAGSHGVRRHCGGGQAPQPPARLRHRVPEVLHCVVVLHEHGEGPLGVST